MRRWSFVDRRWFGRGRWPHIDDGRRERSSDPDDRQPGDPFLERDLDDLESEDDPVGDAVDDSTDDSTDDGAWHVPTITDLLPPRWASYIVRADDDAVQPGAGRVHDVTIDLGRLRHDDPGTWGSWIERWRPGDVSDTLRVVARTTAGGSLLSVEFPGTATRSRTFYPYVPPTEPDGDVDGARVGDGDGSSPGRLLELMAGATTGVPERVHGSNGGPWPPPMPTSRVGDDRSPGMPDPNAPRAPR